MRLFAYLLAALVPLAAQTPLTPKEISDGWLQLFDGETLWGWTPEGGAKWKVSGGIIQSDGGEYGWLRSNTQFGDFILKVDFKTAADGNSGVFLRSKKGPNPHITGYELQIYDQHKEFPTGSLMGAARASKKAHINADNWQTYEVRVIGTKFLVKLDGRKVLECEDRKSAMGYIGLQFNPKKPVQFRNVKVRPLGLAPIFNARNLSGWQQVQPPQPKNPPAEWTVKNGLLHVVKGGGQLETKAMFDDFILQLDIRANSTDPKRHPNSGIFLRGKANTYWTGYEIQVRNEFKDADRTKAVDIGSGGIYHHQPARRVVPADNEFYTQTVIAQGRHLSTWVNGYPVADWEDPYPEGDGGPRNKMALLKAGPLALQAHDPTTNLDFRAIRVKSLSHP